MQLKLPPRIQLSWAFYDWANSAFSTIVIAGFFPVFFKQYWAADLTVTDSTFWLGFGNSLASILIVLLAPIIGAWADTGGHKKRFLLLFAFSGIVMTGGLFLVDQGHWALALALYGFALLGFSGGNICYDALLVDVADNKQFDHVSALGYGMGYLGGGLLFGMNVLVVSQPEWFSLSSSAEAVKLAFISVALWWAIFSIPLMLWVPEAKPYKLKRQGFKAVFDEISGIAREIRQYKMAVWFLLAYWLYIDGVDTIVRMAVDYGLAIGLQSNDLLLALLITQLVGFPAALVFGRIGQRYGPKSGIQIALLVYVLVTFWAWKLDSAWEFYTLACTIGLVQGGIQALSRSLFARLIPPDRAGAFFGLYNMLGKFAAVIGPLLVGWAAMVSGNPRTGILMVLVLFVAGGLLLQRVRVP